MSDDYQMRHLEQTIEKLGRDLKQEIQRVEREAGKRIAELGRKVERVAEFQAGFRIISRTMTFLLAVATAGAAIYGTFLK